MSDALDVVILCGGRGTRAYPDTMEVPKPLLEVSGVPIVEHVIRIYAAQGHRRFLLAGGYKVEVLRDRYERPDPALGLDGCDIEVLDTGLDTQTGERIRLAADHVHSGTFFATYADGLGDVDLALLVDAHRRTGALATVTCVPLPSQYGTLAFDTDGRVVEFREKPRLDDHWINAGFFVFEPAVFGHWRGEVLETEVLPALGEAGVLFAHNHRGFWKSMDTYKDRQELAALADSGHPPWEWSPEKAQPRPGPPGGPGR